MIARLLYGVDVMEGLKLLANESIHCVVTSPPYWGLRFYGVEGQLGLEKTPEEYVEKMVEVFREVRRILRQDGTLWLNLGDSYAGSAQGWGHGKQYAGPKQSTNRGSLNQPLTEKKIGFERPPGYISSRQENGLKPKDLVGIPWRVAFALQADGWWLRSDIIWAKPNPMPESVTDRPTKAHEYIFLMTKSPSYFFDAEAIKEDAHDWGIRDRSNTDICLTGAMPNGQPHKGLTEGDFSLKGRNKRTVWTIATEPYPEAHFATFPMELVKPCILAGTSAEGCCGKCGSPWKRVERVERVEREKLNCGNMNDDGVTRVTAGLKTAQKTGFGKHETLGWQPTCKCKSPKVPCTVLDPFSGSGTTGEVATGLGRNYIGIDLNKKYEALARKRLGLFAMAFEKIVEKE